MPHPDAFTDTFIATLKLDEASFTSLQGLRQRHFPVARNYLPAHLTLVHRLDAAQIARLADGGGSDLLSQPPPELAFSGLRLLGQGVAVAVQSAALQSLRATVVSHAGGALSRQDQQRFNPHVTIQNKVDAALARETFQRLNKGFVPWTGSGVALLIWQYLYGPWRLVHEWPLSRPTGRAEP